MDLRGSKTEEDLRFAFGAESQATNKYEYFASQAKKQGFEQIAAIFKETGANEREHAKLWFKHLGALGDTAKNLASAAEGEKAEWAEMYPRMANEAEAEGFLDIAQQMRSVADVEKMHEERYNTLFGRVQNGTVFSREVKTIWHCRNCGHIEVGLVAPQVCPTCKHPQAYFEELAENY